jgi:hypothetical protein
LVREWKKALLTYSRQHARIYLDGQRTSAMIACVSAVTLNLKLILVTVVTSAVSSKTHTSTEQTNLSFDL